MVRVAVQDYELPDDCHVLMKTLTGTIYVHGDERSKARAVLAHIYHKCIHGDFHSARDSLLMSHLQVRLRRLMRCCLLPCLETVLRPPGGARPLCTAVCFWWCPSRRRASAHAFASAAALCCCSGPMAFSQTLAECMLKCRLIVRLQRSLHPSQYPLNNPLSRVFRGAVVDTLAGPRRGPWPG